MSSEIRRPSDFGPPSTKNAIIDFNNWHQFLQTHREQIRDPLDANFNWWYWCGITNNEEREKTDTTI